MQVVEKWADGQNHALRQDVGNCTKTDTKLAPGIMGDERRINLFPQTVVGSFGLKQPLAVLLVSDNILARWRTSQKL
jgi:hypothetical protein